jgi:hypothetical protein
VRFALGDVVPRIIIQSLHLRVGEFESHLAKRLLQQYLPIAAVGQPLLYHLVGALLDGQRHVDAEGLGGLEVYHEFKFDWLFDR